mgnify:CR=1 FL=1
MERRGNLPPFLHQPISRSNLLRNDSIQSARSIATARPVTVCMLSAILSSLTSI